MNFAEWKKNRKTKEQNAVATEVTAPATPTFSQWMAAKKETSSVEGWLNSVSGFLGDVQTRYQGYNASAEDYNSTFGRSQELLSAADNWRKQYAGDAAATKSIDQAVAMLSQAQEYAKGYYDFYSQFGSADEYDTWTRKRDFINRYQQDAEAALAGDYKESWLGEAETKRLAGNADFDEKSAYQSTATGKKFGKKYGDKLYEVINAKPEDKHLYLSELDEQGLTSFENDYYNRALAYLDEDEIKAYNYLYATEGKDAAEEYLDSLHETLVARKVGKQYEAIDNDFERYLHGIGTGFEQFATGLRNAGAFAFGTDNVDTPFSQYTSAMVRKDLAGKGFKFPEWMGGGSSAQMGYDILNTSANMVPSILVSLIPSVGSVAGVASMGISAAGNAYSEMLSMGYDNRTSQNYAFLVGASEAILQRLMGGISSLGKSGSGIFEQAAAKILPKIDRALARVAVKLGASVLDEATEEGVQSILEPIFKMLATGEDFEGIDWEEVTYSALLGGITGGVFEGAPTVAGTAINSASTKKVYGMDQAALLDEALELNPGNKYVQSLKAKADSGKTLSGMELNRLVEMNETKIANLDADMAEEPATPSAEGEALTRESETVKETETATEEERGAETEYEPYRATETENTTDARSALADASKKYGKQAGAMVALYRDGQDVDAYNRAFGIAYDMGKAGVSLSYAMKSEATQYLTEDQRKLAHQIGAEATSAKAEILDKHNKSLANGKEGRRKGAVKGEGVTVAELRETFNDTQGVAYKILSTFAEATGIDIVLYKSEPNAKGDYEGAQGRFKWKENTIYVDVNAGHTNVKSVGDLAKYTMVRTFGHEFVHFLEKWNPIRYAEFRRAVFDAMETNGEDVDGLIRIKMEQDDSGKMTYDLASREVVAEAMADVLPDANFVRELAEKHKTIFDKLLEQFKAFVADLKAYFNTIQRGRSSTREAKALMEQVGDSVKYAESIVKLFDRVAVEAVEAYQRTVAEDVVSEEVSEEVVDDVIEDIPEDISEQIAEEIPEEAPAEAEEEGGDAFVITDNPEYGSLEIKFDGKPPDAVRNALKARKFRWNGKKGIWYGKADRADIIRDLREAYKAEEAPAVETPSVEAPVEEAKIEAVPEGVGEYADNYDLLRTALANVNRYDIGGFSFRVREEGGYWRGTVDSVHESDIGIKISDASGIHYKSDLVATRQEAVDDVIGVAENNKLIGAMQAAPAAENVVKTPVSDTSTTQNRDTMDTEAHVAEETAPAEEVEATIAPATEAELEAKEKAFDKKFAALDKSKWRFASWPSPSNVKFILDGALGIRATEDEILTGQVKYMKGRNELSSFGDLPAYLADSLKNANQLVTDAPVEIKYNGKSLLAFTVDGANYFFSKKYVSALDGSIFYMGDFSKTKILKAVDESGEIVGMILPVMVPKSFREEGDQNQHYPGGNK